MSFPARKCEVQHTKPRALFPSLVTLIGSTSLPLFCHILHFQSICHSQWKCVCYCWCLWSVVVSGSAISQHSALLCCSVLCITLPPLMDCTICIALSCLAAVSSFPCSHHSLLGNIMSCLVLSCPVLSCPHSFGQPLLLISAHLAALDWSVWLLLFGAGSRVFILIFCLIHELWRTPVYTSSLRQSLLISDFTACLALFFVVAFNFPVSRFVWLILSLSLSLSSAPPAATL